jgi:glycerol-3-phosphate dehydrogenase (NAD+)
MYRHVYHNKILFYNWITLLSAIAKIIGNNVVEKSDKFEKEVRMWVFEEMVNGRKLTEIINQDHENLKYLPGIL